MTERVELKMTSLLDPEQPLMEQILTFNRVIALANVALESYGIKLVYVYQLTEFIVPRDPDDVDS